MMLSFRLFQAAGGGNSAAPLQCIFNFTHTKKPISADQLSMNFAPLPPPNFNFEDNTYAPPSGDDLHFNF